MKTSKAGILAILDHEAVVLTPYKDVVGVWTVAVGHTKSAGAPDPRHVSRLNLEEALSIFETDLAKFEKRVNAAFTVPLKQHEFDAAVSFDFNTGAIHRATWVKTMNAGDKAKAVAQIMNWQKPKAIIGRRRKEQALFNGGGYPTITRLKVYLRYPGDVDWVPVPVRYRGGPAPSKPTPPAPAPKPIPAKPKTITPKAAPVKQNGGFWTWFFGLFR